MIKMKTELNPKWLKKLRRNLAKKYPDDASEIKEGRWDQSSAMREMIQDQVITSILKKT